MAIIQQHDKRSGLTYFYDSHSYWDKEKKQSRAHRTLIGRLDPETGQMVPTDGRGRHRSPYTHQSETQQVSQVQEQVQSHPEQQYVQAQAETQAMPRAKTERKFFGATYLLDQIAQETGVLDDLKHCFPKDYKKILSIAYYLILEDRNPLLRFKKWHRTHRHPHEHDIPSQQSSKLFQSITEDAKLQFFHLQGRRRSEKEYWAYDSTSISSYSKRLKHVKHGKNKENDPLEQINLLLLYGTESGLPFYYRKLAGNIPDVKTLRSLIPEMRVLHYEMIKLLMDRGFYSIKNINAMCAEDIKFLLSASTSRTYIKEFIQELGTDIKNLSNYNEQYEVFASSKIIFWDSSKKCPYKNISGTSGERMFLHLYYNPEKALEEEKQLLHQLSQLKTELITGKRQSSHESAYKKFFVVHENANGDIRVEANEAAIAKAKERYGYFALLSNEVSEPIKALELYRMRDVIEKAFENVKDRLNCRRTLVSSDESLEGKLFVEFIALIFLSYITKKMQEQELFSKYTLQGLLDELDVIECFIGPDSKPITGEVLEKQEQLYVNLGVTPLLATSHSYV